MKRVNLFLGHYGSGKTNVAVNYALMLKRDVIVYDLDIVNPYFRTLNSDEMLKKSGIILVASSYANTNVDLPAMSPKYYRMVEDKTMRAVVDIGGDDRGALALGRYRAEILKENNYDMFLVINMYRYETRDVESILEIKREIEETAGIKFTAIINNSNLGPITTSLDIMKSVPFANEVSKRTGLEVRYTAIRKDLACQVNLENILPMELIDYGLWV